MGLEQIKIVEEVGSLAELYEQVAKLQRTLRYLLNGNLDFQNIRVKGVIAETIDVDELSAITANLGHIISGLIETVTMIGSLIMTDLPGNYPRAEMSNTDKMFKVEQSATNRLEVIASGEEGLPQIVWVRGPQWVKMGHGVGTSAYPGISSSDPLVVFAWGGLYLAGANIVESWSDLIRNSDGKTLDQEIDGLRSSINSLNTSISTLTGVINDKANKNVSTSSAGSANGGIPIGTQLAVNGGGYVTWNGIPSHSHTQN